MATRLVIIDDECGVLLALKLCMQSVGYEVRDFHSPFDAVEYLRSSKDYDLVLCDMRMPELTGLDVLRELRSFNTGTPFVLMSGHIIGEDAEHAIKSGATAFLSKPFSPSELQAVLSKF